MRYCSTVLAVGVLLFAVALFGAAGRAAQPGAGVVLKVTDFGAVGDGVTDDTDALQKAIDAAIAQHGTLLFPPGPGGVCYSSRTLYIKDADHLTLRGQKGVICWLAGGELAQRTGLTYQGNVSNLTIEGMELTGVRSNPLRTAGIEGRSGANLKNITIYRNYIHDVSLGISLNADTAGTINGFLIAENKVENIQGTAVGDGYGIHHANGSGQPSNGRIVANTVIGCERNSIYQGKGSGVIIANNIILRHGGNRPPQNSPLTGIQVARGSQILVTGNLIDGAMDGSIVVGTDHQIPTHDITLIGNRLINPRGRLAMLTIGSAAPSREGNLDHISVIGNIFQVNNAHILPIQVNCGKQLNIVGNSIQVQDAPAFAAAIQIRGSDERPGSADYTDQVTISHNLINIHTLGADGAAIQYTSQAAASSIGTRFVGNTIHAPSGAFHVDGRSWSHGEADKGKEGHLRVQMQLNAEPPNADLGCTQDVVRVPGAAVGDAVHVTYGSSLPSNTILEGSVTAPDQVTVKWCQLYGAPVDPDGGGGLYTIDVWKP